MNGHSCVNLMTLNLFNVLNEILDKHLSLKKMLNSVSSLNINLKHHLTR